MVWSNFPQCERCWISANTTWDSTAKTISIRPPIRVLNSGTERCGWCGEFTVMGIYVRADSEEINYPSYEEDEGL